MMRMILGKHFLWSILRIIESWKIIIENSIPHLEHFILYFLLLFSVSDKARKMANTGNFAYKYCFLVDGHNNVSWPWNFWIQTLSSVWCLPGGIQTDQAGNYGFFLSLKPHKTQSGTKRCSFLPSATLLTPNWRWGEALGSGGQKEERIKAMKLLNFNQFS